MNKLNYFKLNIRGILCSFLLFMSVLQLYAKAPLTEAAVTAMQQQQRIRGIVRDTAGFLPGVSVRVKGTKIGTTTDVNGAFTLNIPDALNKILVFSMVGYAAKEMVVKDFKVLNILMTVVDAGLEEVVVVGFGKQKRTDMVGSIVSVKPSALKVPSSNLTTALAGRAAGVIAYQRSGEPGLDNADFFIRGVTTFGYKVDPLILIDNVEVTKTDLARLQVDDIADFSILKDATATAIYGARGANGVILIATKQGHDGATNLNFRIENSISSPTRNIELADPVTYMQLHNEAILTRDPKGAILYQLEKIENTAVGKDPFLYPAVDWRKELLKDYTSNQRANLSVTGGGKKANYFVSGAMNKDNGLLKVPKESNFNNNISLSSYSLRANVNMNLTKSTLFTVRLNGNFDDYSGPESGGAETYGMIMRTNPVLFAPYYPKGDKEKFLNHILFGSAENGGVNPYAQLVKGYKEYSRSMMLAQLELKQDLDFVIKGLNFRSLINTTRNSYFDVNRAYNPFYYQMLGVDELTGEYMLDALNPDGGTEYLDYREGQKTLSTVFYMESALNYNRTFASKHTLSGLLVYMRRNALNANASSLQLSLPFRNEGLSGRATYNYDNRYYTEFNFGYNGSERFHESHRYGFFPSVGLAWSVSNEQFFKPYKNIVNNLRIRGTYGVVGNDAIGSDANRFLYLSELNMNAGDRNFVFGDERGNGKNGIRMTRYANPDITWEKAFKSNLALELGLFNKFQIMGDVFYEKRKNIFMERASIPSTMGLVANTPANIGEAVGKGFDGSIDFNHSFSNRMWLQLRGNFTCATSKYTVFEEPSYGDQWLSRVGHKISQQWGYIAERLFVDDEEVLNSPEQIFGTAIVRGGDIKYRDVNGDGKITELDRVPIGNPTTPEIVYGFGFSLGIRNLDFSAFFQGLSNESFWIDATATSPFVGSRQLLQAYADSYWSEGNRDIYALWPRLSDVNVTNNQNRSTWFMKDGSFLRLKQVEVGYTLPTRITDKLNMKMFRLYANGSNLLTFSKFKLWDVEMAGSGLGYPVQRVFNIGINAGF